MSSYSIGIDIGSTTLKAVLIKKTNQQQVLLETYQRHQTRVKECLRDCLKAVKEKVREAKKTEPQQQGEPSGEAASPDDTKVFICLTGSVGMGIAERWSLPFLQEVVAATHYIKVYHPDIKAYHPDIKVYHPDTSNPSDPNIPKASPNSSKTHYPNGSGPSSSPISTLIDIGGEDAKMIFFDHGEPTDLRMNGNCAGGTGAFIDQMAALLNVTPEELGTMAEGSKRLYPIASRCGVFCKTDIQNLIARNAARADIAASIFHAVAVQTVTTLAHGHPINAPLLLCGGPLTFIPALRTAFASYLQLPAESLILPPKAHLIPAWGAALAAGGAPISLSELMRRLDEQPDVKAAPRQPISTPTDNHAPSPSSSPLLPLFKNREEHAAWSERLSGCSLKRATMPEGTVTAFLGVDSGSTTTKLVVLDTRGRMLFSHYRNNHGDPIKAVEEALRELSAECSRRGTTLVFAGSCSTGYGEDLVKAAFSLHTGIVETMAHYLAARSVEPRVSFVLDIGGQDMKAMFVDKSINRIEVNEACSSGCGSFISTFAQSLGLTVQAFAEAACYADAPCDLGTKCTVFMNSKVKQVLREGRPTADIAAGLAYSVVRNCLYKVLRLKDIDTLGDHIVVQGGTMRNDSVVRALERLTGKQVLRCDAPELMGALGCALHAMQTAEKARPGMQDAATEQAAEPLTLGQMTAKAACTTSLLHCHGCENRCAITRYRFDNANVYFSGNRCEKIFSDSGARSLDAPDRRRAINVYEEKRRLLFDRRQEVPKPLLTIGLPRCLNMYEEYPFWHTLFSECGLRVLLSEASSLPHYERCASLVMSDNICFPAKLAHSHIRDLQIVPFFTPFISPVIPPLMALAGYDVDNLPMSDQLSSEWGLKYSNNEVCYPATLVVGDIIKAFKSGAYDPRHTCVAMVQTGGQCRASNYLPLIRKALLEAGYTQTPVVSVSLGSGISNYQPGFRVSWRRLLPITLATLLYTDTIARFYYASVVREKHPGAADQLRQRYLDAARRAIAHRRTDELFSYLSQAARDFDSICLDRTCPRVGIVGEIFLKYHPFAQKHVTEWS